MEDIISPAARQSTLDLLDELPDFQSELIPVQDFWQDYVQQLEQRGVTQAEAVQDGSGDADSAYEAFPFLNGGRGEITSAASDGMVLDSLPSGLFIDVPGMAPIPTPSTSFTNNNSPTAQPLQLQQGTLPAFSGVNVNFDLKTDRDSSQKDNYEVSQVSSQLNSKRNAKQQQQNKQAQQRYRERRKMKFVEMESTIDSLSNQLMDMTNVKNQNALLKNKTSDLENLLKQKEREIHNLKQALKSQSSSTDLEHGEALIGNLPAGEKGISTESYQRDFEASLGRLRDLAFELRLHQLQSTGEEADKETVARVEDAVNAVCSACWAAIREQGIKVLELMSKDVTECSKVHCMEERAKWVKILDVLRLTPSQQQHLILLRQDHLGKLRECYEERQNLNMQAMSLMLPHAGKRLHSPEIEDKMKCMTIAGHEMAMRDNVDLARVLDRIKDNLRREQKAMMELNWCTMHRVLSPIQAALLLVEIFPEHLDSLKLANMTVYKLKTQQPQHAGSEDSELSEECSLSSYMVHTDV